LDASKESKDGLSDWIAVADAMKQGSGERINLREKNMITENHMHRSTIHRCPIGDWQSTGMGVTSNSLVSARDPHLSRPIAEMRPTL
jgi:UDP-2,3-diacylglucosamine pyrophosphatase LpxH